MPYRVEWTSHALRDVKKLKKAQRAIVLSWVKNELEQAEDPCALPNAKPLEGTKGGWRWRLGTYRIIGTVEQSVVTITIFRVGHRRDVYRRMPQGLKS